MKRIIAFLLIFSSNAMAMDRVATLELLERQRQEKQKNERAERLGKELTQKLAKLVHEPYLYSPEQSEHIVKESENLIRQGADVNLMHEFHALNYVRFYSPLTSVIKLKDPELVKLLLERGAHVNHKEILHILVDSYDRPNALEAEKSVLIAKMLIEHGADINEQSFGREDTPLMRAVIYDNVPLVRLLTEGVDAQPIREFEELPENIKNKIYLAQLPPEIRKMAFRYLKIKADPNLRNSGNQTALDIARFSLDHAQNDPEFFRNIDNNKQIADYQEIIRILEPVTSTVQIQPSQQPQPQQSWWQKLWRR